jgi:hypothetical protein
MYSTIILLTYLELDGNGYVVVGCHHGSGDATVMGMGWMERPSSWLGVERPLDVTPPSSGPSTIFVLIPTVVLRAASYYN